MSFLRIYPNGQQFYSFDFVSYDSSKRPKYKPFAVS